MENTPINEIVAPSKINVLFEVTRFSKILATVLFIILPFIGGLIGYTYGTNSNVDEVITITDSNDSIITPTPEIITPPITTLVSDEQGWVTISTEADGKKINFQYPQEIPVDVKVLEPLTLNELGIDPGFPNYTLPLTDTSEILVAELTTDLKYIFYLKRDTKPDGVALYKSTISSKTIEKITDYNVGPITDFSIFMPQEYAGYLFYNKQLDPKSNNVYGTISKIENSKPLFVAPCAHNRFGNNDISPDKLHIIWNCDKDALYISDWKNTRKLLEYSENSMIPTAVSFMNNERIKFANASEGSDMLRAPYRSVKIDGTDMRLESGDVYLGY